MYEICKKFIGIREELRDYTRGLTKQAHEKGTPVMRTLFFEFPDDPQAWEIDRQYMFGSRYMVVPVLEPGQRRIAVYLPAGAYWTLWSKTIVQQDGIPRVYAGGTSIEVDCPIETIPVFYRVND